MEHQLLYELLCRVLSFLNVHLHLSLHCSPVVLDYQGLSFSSRVVSNERVGENAVEEVDVEAGLTVVVLGDHFEDQEELLQLQPAHHTLHNLEDLFRVKGVVHEFDDLGILEHSFLIEEVDDGSHLLQNARMGGLPQKQFDNLAFLEPVDEQILELLFTFGLQNEVIDDAKALKFLFHLLCTGQQPIHSRQYILLSQFFLKLAYFQQQVEVFLEIPLVQRRLRVILDKVEIFMLVQMFLLVGGIGPGNQEEVEK
jgi:hypothetical protein